MVKAFTFDEFSENRGTTGPGHAAFVNLFTEGEPVAEAEPMADPEDNARKVFEDAFVQGEKAGYEMGLKRVDPLVKRLNAYLAETDAFRRKLTLQCESMAVELALMFAKAIVLRDCEEDRSTIVRMAKKAMEACEEKSDITIRLRKADAQHINGDEISPLRVVIDDTISEPGFVIETNFGDIDGRISTQFEELTKKIKDGNFGE